ncbi:hypothetical protein SK128_013474 [Halocaridina rubra]|uniref:Crustacean hyperglycemic hormone n=1 Tax=Halocaridina rubra TaxID=373956 RepID=A0AAN8WK51_HALRR
MFSSRMISAAMMLFLVIQQFGHSTTARSVEAVGRIEKLLSSAPRQSLANGHNLNKRAAFDESCKGIYDRELLGMLERVCEDCYNLYRKPYVGVECRTNCYQNKYFRQCLDDLQIIEDVEKYVNAVQVVGR